MRKGTLQEHARKERVLYAVIESDIKRLNLAGGNVAERCRRKIIRFRSTLFLASDFSIYFLDLPFGNVREMRETIKGENNL